MKLLMIRHARAEGFVMDDSARALTEKGRNQARRVGEFLKSRGLVPEVTLSSPYVRARETAEIFCASAGAGAPLIQPWLACGMRPGEALSELAAFGEFGTVAVCGHNPDFAHLAETLLGSQTGTVHVGKASVIVFDGVQPPRHGGCLSMALPASVL